MLNKFLSGYSSSSSDSENNNENYNMAIDT